jgi:DNA ligase-1
MKRFARLYSAIDSTTSTNRKVEAMVEYFAEAAPADAAWAVYFLSGGRPKRLIPVRRVATWAMEESGIPEWLFEESYHAVGDLAETIALLLPEATGTDLSLPLHEWVENRLLPLAQKTEEEQRRAVLGAWRQLAGIERYIWNKLITGSFRVGVSEQLVVRALAHASGIEEGVIAHRMSGHFTPTAETFTRLVAADSSDADRSRPFPFYLAYALEGELESLGDAHEWQAEWKWDGIRAQLIRRDGKTYIWSRGGELVTERFPELTTAAESLPDGTVLDGEIMPWMDGALPFAQLQRRIGRKKLGAKILAEVPVVLIAYDLLELAGRDLRAEPMSVRRAALGSLLAECRPDQSEGPAHPFLLSPTIQLETWADASSGSTASTVSDVERAAGGSGRSSHSVSTL